MTIREDLTKYSSTAFGSAWTVREGKKVPKEDEVGLGNDAVTVEGAVLYADLTDSTGLVRDYSSEFAAEVYKTFVYCAARVIRNRGGSVTAYDGDRVMGVFIGGTAHSDAARAALEIYYAREKIIQPELDRVYGGSKFQVRHKVGIDRSQLFVANTGIRGNTDLVWVGNAANRAAKMSALNLGYSTYISSEAYGYLLDSSKYKDGSPASENMWVDLGRGALGFGVYGSNYWWQLA